MPPKNRAILQSEQETQQPPEQPSQPIKVRALGNFGEPGGAHYKHGDEFETTPQRAAALGPLVEPVTE